MGSSKINTQNKTSRHYYVNNQPLARPLGATSQIRNTSIRCKFSNILKIDKYINLCNITEKSEKETYPKGPIIRLPNRCTHQLLFLKENSLIF